MNNEKTEYIGRDNDVKTIYGRTMTHKYFGKDFKIILVLALVAVVLVAPACHHLEWFKDNNLTKLQLPR